MRRTESKDIGNDQHWLYSLQHLDSWLGHKGKRTNSKVNHICSKKMFFWTKDINTITTKIAPVDNWHIFWCFQYLRANLALLFCIPWGQHFENLFNYDLSPFLVLNVVFTYNYSYTKRSLSSIILQDWSCAFLSLTIVSYLKKTDFFWALFFNFW